MRVPLARCWRSGEAGSASAGSGAGSGAGSAAAGGVNDAAAVVVGKSVILRLIMFWSQFLVRHGRTLGPTDGTAIILQGHLTLAGAIDMTTEGYHTLRLTPHTLTLIAALHPGLSTLVELIVSLRLTVGIRILLAALLADPLPLLAIAAPTPLQPVVIGIPYLGTVGLRPALVLATALTRRVHVLGFQLDHGFAILAVWNIACLADALLGQATLCELPVRDMAGEAVVVAAIAAVAAQDRGRHLRCGHCSHRIRKGQIHRFYFTFLPYRTILRALHIRLGGTLHQIAWQGNWLEFC